MSEEYSFIVKWSDEDQGYIASVPEFKTLESFGETEVEAIKNAKESLTLFIEEYEERGIQLPAPKRVSEYSGQFRLRLPKSLHKQLALQAEDEGISLNQHCIYLLSENRAYRVVKSELDQQKVAMQQNLEIWNEKIFNQTTGTSFIDSTQSFSVDSEGKYNVN